MELFYKSVSRETLFYFYFNLLIYYLHFINTKIIIFSKKRCIINIENKGTVKRSERGLL